MLCYGDARIVARLASARGASTVARLISQDVSKVEAALKEMGARPWREGESEKLRRLWIGRTIGQLAGLFPGRTQEEIVAEAERLGLNRETELRRYHEVEYSPMEAARLKQYYAAKVPIETMAQRLGRSIHSIKRALHKFEINKTSLHAGRPVTEEERAIIREFYGKISPIELSAKIGGRSLGTIRGTVARMRKAGSMR
jgi:transposase